MIHTSAALATAARCCEALSRVHRLASWVGEGKPVTPKHVLRPRDAPAAERAMGFLGSSRLNTAADSLQLHRPWRVALAIDFLRIADGEARTGPTFTHWPDADDATVCQLWLTGLIVALATDAGKEDQVGAAVFVRIILGALATSPAPSAVELWERARIGLMTEDSYAADPFFPSVRSLDSVITAPFDRLVEFGAATRHGEQLEMTPLGRWALQQMHARKPKPITADLPAGEVIARIAGIEEYDAWRNAEPWLVNRDPLQAARGILTAAATATPSQRVAAVALVELLGKSAHPVWSDVATLPNLAVHARVHLTDWDRPRAMNSEDLAWLAVDYAVAALTDSGPDEALSRITERLPGQDLDSRLGEIRHIDHPNAAVLTEALTAFVASGGKPTSSQIYQLKISLKRMRNPIWRRVLVPATASLGELHRVIQIVMNWDGDHLHAFFVGNKHYSNPFYRPAFRDEEGLRLRGAFTPLAKTITYLYDFGTSWHHDITCEKMLDLDAGATYPVCVTGRGDFPIEHWSDEDDDQQPVPFDKGKVNSRLADIEA